MFKVPVAEHVPKAPRTADRALAVLRRLDARDRRRVLERLAELDQVARSSVNGHSLGGGRHE